MVWVEGHANQEHMASSQPNVWADVSSKCLTLDHSVHDSVLTQKNISLGKIQLKRRFAEVQEAVR